jgi:DNA polymerase-3 subunit delta'
MKLTPLNNHQVFGHHDVKEWFINAYQANKIPPSLMLFGPKGIGKSTLAYNMLKLMFTKANGFDDSNLKNNPIISQIEAGSFPDLLVLDAEYLDGNSRKKNVITIDEVRKINNFSRLTSSGSGVRVVLIDGADCLNQNAANALLKILEEPVGKTHFILIASSLFKVLPTIRSRVVKIKCNSLAIDDYQAALKLNGAEVKSFEVPRLYDVSSSNIQFSLNLLKHDPELKLVSELENIITSGSIAHLMKFVDDWTTTAENWEFGKDMLIRVYSKYIEETAAKDLSSIGNLLNKFEMLKERINAMEIYNLDRQHVLLSTLG